MVSTEEQSAKQVLQAAMVAIVCDDLSTIARCVV
jgi:hypothetical protein